MKHERALEGRGPYFVLDDSQNVMQDAKDTFATDEAKELVSNACRKAAGFVLRNEIRYEYKNGHVVEIEEPIVKYSTLQVAAKPDLDAHTPFAIARSKQAATERVISNAINHALICLADADLFSHEWLESADSLIFDIAGEKVTQELQMRKETGLVVPAMSLIEAVRLVYPHASRSRQHHMRDVVTILAISGLITGSHSLGDGYCLRPGPVLTELFKVAINPALAKFKLY